MTSQTSSGGTPTGAAGGALAGTYPSPSLSGVGIPSELGYVETIVSQASIGTSATDLTSLSLTVTVGSRPIIVEVFLPLMAPSSSTARMQLLLVDVTASATIQLTYVLPSGTGGTFANGKIRVNPAAGSRTYKAQALIEAGTMTAFADASSHKWLRVYEV